MAHGAQLAQDAAEALDARIEEENLDGQVEAEELREALERVQALSLKVSEELNAYQDRHARKGTGWQELRSPVLLRGRAGLTKVYVYGPFQAS